MIQCVVNGKHGPRCVAQYRKSIARGEIIGLRQVGREAAAFHTGCVRRCFSSLGCTCRHSIIDLDLGRSVSSVNPFQLSVTSSVNSAEAGSAQFSVVPWEGELGWLCMRVTSERSVVPTLGGGAVCSGERDRSRALQEREHGARFTCAK